MKRPVNHPRTSAAKAGWVVALLIVAVPVFIFWPRAPDEPATPPPPIERPPSKLTKVGLPDDPDIEGLPGFFAVWADYAEWKDNKTTFAYRHPVSGEFSLFFEASRVAEGFRFRPIARPEGELREMGPGISIAFFQRARDERADVSRAMEPTRIPTPETPKVEVDLGRAKGTVPEIGPPR